MTASFYRNNLLFFLVALFSLTACSKDPARELSVSAQLVELDAEGAVQTIDVSSNVQWNATVSNGQWLRLSPSQASGSVQIQIKADANISGVERSATVLLKAQNDESLSASFTVKQVPVSLSFSPDPVKVKSEGESVVINVVSNTKWEIVQSDETQRVSLSKTSGEGNAAITATVTANPNNKVAKIPLKFSYFGIYKTLYIEQEPGPNTAPTKPEFTSPVNGAEGVYTNVKFAWNCKDADGDTLTYHLYLSTDGTNFNEYGPIKHERVYNFEENLQVSTKYYAKVKADDGAGETSESDVITFTTCATSLYADGEWMLYQKSTKANPIKLVFTGDGFVKEHYENGGLFDQKADKAIEGFFSVEPYKSYRDYFTVYKIVAYSQEAGTTITSTGQKRSTAFSAVCEGGGSTGVSCNYDKVFTWVKKIPDITDADLAKNSICLLINEQIYAGTCVSYQDGKSIAMVPLQNNDSQLVSTLVHEFGGHGFGRLVDEYIVHDSSPTQDVLDRYKSCQDSWAYGFGLNMSLTNKQAETPWSMLIGQKGYEHVALYEGGWLYKYGIWRSEQVSCMHDNRLYFDSISRYLIVKRILAVAEEEMTLESFMAKDVQKTDPTGGTKAPDNFVPLGPTILIFNEN